MCACACVRVRVRVRPPPPPRVFRASCHRCVHGLLPTSLLGYANEVGEAFKMFLSKKLYLGTYAVASAYCLADAGLHGHEAVAHRYPARPPWPGHPSWVGTTAFADAALWQGMASVVIPGFTINRLVAAATKLLANPAAPSNPTVRSPPARPPPPRPIPAIAPPPAWAAVPWLWGEERDGCSGLRYSVRGFFAAACSCKVTSARPPCIGYRVGCFLGSASCFASRSPGWCCYTPRWPAVLAHCLLGSTPRAVAIGSYLARGC